jgi:hypothetical protein
LNTLFSVRAKMSTIAALGLLCAAGGTVTPIERLAGRYGRMFFGDMLDGSTFAASDRVDIVPVDRTHAYVRADLDFDNAHHCSLAGIAELAGDRLIYRERIAQPGNPLCRLTVYAQGNALVLDDERGSCQAYCGARGSFSDFRFIALSSRRAIVNPAALRRSPRYRAAIDDWKSAELE